MTKLIPGLSKPIAAPAIIGGSKQKSACPDFIKRMGEFKGPDRHQEAMLAAFHGLEHDAEVDDLVHFRTILTDPPNENSNSPYCDTIKYLRIYKDKPLEFITSIMVDWGRR